MKKHAALLLAAVAVLGATEASNAAAPAKTKTIFFDVLNGSGTGGCTPTTELDLAVEGKPCSSEQVGAKGTGLLTSESYGAVKKAIGFKLNSSKHLTGSVALTNYTIVSSSALPSDKLPGLAGAEVTITVNGVPLGTAKGSGVSTPTADVVIPINFAIPASLNGKKVTTITADLKYTDGSGLTSVAFEQSQSKLVFPTR